jgi:phosphatidylglycerophosphate synthase
MNRYSTLLRDVRSSYRESAKYSVTVNSGSVLQIYFLKPVSLYMTPFFVWLGVTPNQVTWISFAFGLAGCATLALGLPPFAVIGAWLYLVHRLLDHVDGNLARFRRKTSRYGHFLDASLDIVIQTALMVGVGIGAYRQVQAGHAWGAQLVPLDPAVLLLAGAGASLFWQLSRHIKLLYNSTLAASATGHAAVGAEAVLQDESRRHDAARNGSWARANLARRSVVPLVRVPGLIVAAHTNTLLLYLGFFAVFFPAAFALQYGRTLMVARRKLRAVDSRSAPQSASEPRTAAARTA